jgi:hypothetical protein
MGEDGTGAAVAGVYINALRATARAKMFSALGSAGTLAAPG